MKKEKTLKQLVSAYKRLKEAVDLGKSAPLAVDGTVQRFEFCFELSWKTIKAFLEDDGVLCSSPKNCLQEAFQRNIIVDEDGWLSLLEARNLTVHVYDEKMSQKIYDIVVKKHILIEQLIKKLSDHLHCS